MVYDSCYFIAGGAEALFFSRELMERHRYLALGSFLILVFFIVFFLQFLSCEREERRVSGDEVWIGAVDGVFEKKERDWCLSGCAENPVLAVGS